MSDLLFNKYAAAVLATGLVFMAVKEISHAALHVKTPETPAYSVGPIIVETDDTVEELPFPQITWVDAMDSERGAKVFKQCTSCHSADSSMKHGTGPNLWEIVGRPAGVVSDFSYSGAMANSGLIWDYETLDGFLTKPTKYLSGTNMNFIGLKKEADRAAVIEYLRQSAAVPRQRPIPIIEEAPDMVEDTSQEDVAEIINETDTPDINLEDAQDTVEELVDQTDEIVNEIADDVKDATESSDPN